MDVLQQKCVMERKRTNVEHILYVNTEINNENVSDGLTFLQIKMDFVASVARNDNQWIGSILSNRDVIIFTNWK